MAKDVEEESLEQARAKRMFLEALRNHSEPHRSLPKLVVGQ